ncbi:MAG: lactate utilization protein [bacterium]
MSSKSVTTTLENLSRHGFAVFFVETREEALVKAKEFIPLHSSVGLGGSESVKQVGLLEYVLGRDDLVVFNQYEDGISLEENMERRRKGLLSDVYLTSTNAITEDGYLVNVDGSGNRLAAFAYGPKRVLVIAGVNKIVPTVEAGFRRIEEIAAPLNVERLNKRAATFGKEQKYTIDTVNNQFLYTKRSEKRRIVVVLVGEELGY